MITEAIQLVHFVLSVHSCCGCLNTAWLPKTNGQEPRHAVPTKYAALLVVCRPVAAVTAQIETVNRTLLTVEAAADKDLGGDFQLFPPNCKVLLEF